MNDTTELKSTCRTGSKFEVETETKIIEPERIKCGRFEWAGMGHPVLIDGVELPRVRGFTIWGGVNTALIATVDMIIDPRAN